MLQDLDDIATAIFNASKMPAGQPMSQSMA